MKDEQDIIDLKSISRRELVRKGAKAAYIVPAVLAAIKAPSGPHSHTFPVRRMRSCFRRNQDKGRSAKHVRRAKCRAPMGSNAYPGALPRRCNGPLPSKSIPETPKSRPL
jgi:hypothetical protein